MDLMKEYKIENKNQKVIIEDKKRGDGGYFWIVMALD